jgi:hypothetical protein
VEHLGRVLQWRGDQSQQGLLARLSAYWLTQARMHSQLLGGPRPHWWPLLHATFCAVVLISQTCHLASRDVTLDTKWRCADKAVAAADWLLLLDLAPLCLSARALSSVNHPDCYGWLPSWQGTQDILGDAKSYCLHETGAACSPLANQLKALHTWCDPRRR